MFSFVQPQGPEIRIQRKLLNKLVLFQKRPELFGTGSYTITSGVSPDVVDLFFARVGGDRSEPVASEKVEQLRALCDELGFSGFDDEFRVVISSGSRIEKDLVPLRSRVDRHDVLLEKLQRQVFELERQLHAQRDMQQRVEDVERRIDATDRAVAEIRGQDVSEEIQWLKTEVCNRASAADVMALAAEVSCLKESEAKRMTMTPPLKATAKMVAVQSACPVVQQPAKSSAPVQQVDVPTGVQILYNASKPLDGVIAFLTRCWYDKHGRGPYSHPHVVQATASSVGWSGSGPEHAADLEKYNYFCSNGEVSPWICFWLKGKRVAPTGYSIRTSRGPFPKSWVFEVSKDGKQWEIVDSRQDEQFNTEFQIRNFTIGAPSPGVFGWIRLRATVSCQLGVAALEVFGTLLTE